jgi:tetratricopeptide (TPR) repeat protein
MSTSTSTPANLTQHKSTHIWLGASFILIATLLVYLPAIRGGYIWDDPQHITDNPTLRDSHGLVQMWTVPTSLPQWYPLVHTTFWIEYHLWGLEPLGYHLDNVLLHIVAALLVWRVLSILEIPGAWLAAAIFALHPLQVESVAWITERKNVLSAVFDLLALLCYLRFLNSPKNHRAYFAALIFFLAALLSKSVVATLPAAILVILWFKRGTLRWRDVLPLIPFFVLGIALGLFTAYLEKTHVGATGEHVPELNFSIADRVLIAGRVIWFYTAKLVWPWPLAFIYPRWNIDPHIWWQWLFPFAAIVVLVFLALSRKRPAAAAATFIFCGTLFPVLGFLNVYPMRFSFVADHFQYHASIALIALAAAIAWRYAGIYASVLLIPLIILTAMRTPAYHDAETLWRDTLEKNPDSWMVQTNLAHVLRSRGEESGDGQYLAEAEQHYWRALELAPTIHDTQTNVGSILGRRGDYENALIHFQAALQVDPDFAPAYYGIGQVYQAQGKLDLAIEYFNKALAIAPFYPEANFRLGIVLEQQGKLAEAAEHYRAAVTAEPENAEMRYNLGTCLLKMRQYEEAIYNLREAVRIKPDDAQAWFNLAMSQKRVGQDADALSSMTRALQLDPSLMHQH